MVEKETFCTTWIRKSKLDPKEGDIECAKDIPVFNIDENDFNKLAFSLADFDKEEREKFGIKEEKPKISKEQEEELKKIGAEPMGFCTAKKFIITDGKRTLAIDTQGFCYPRYKGVVGKTPYEFK